MRNVHSRSVNVEYRLPQTNGVVVKVLALMSDDEVTWIRTTVRCGQEASHRYGCAWRAVVQANRKARRGTARKDRDYCEDFHVYSGGECIRIISPWLLERLSRGKRRCGLLVESRVATVRRHPRLFATVIPALRHKCFPLNPSPERERTALCRGAEGVVTAYPALIGEEHALPVRDPEAGWRLSPSRSAFDGATGRCCARWPSGR